MRMRKHTCVQKGVEVQTKGLSKGPQKPAGLAVLRLKSVEDVERVEKEWQGKVVDGREMLLSRDRFLPAPSEIRN
jgi:hypothetical protein